MLTSVALMGSLGIDHLLPSGGISHVPNTTSLAPPDSGAFGCFAFHNELDGRTDILKMTKTEKRAEWFLAIDKTQSIWRQMGLLPKE